MLMMRAARLPPDIKNVQLMLMMCIARAATAQLVLVMCPGKAFFRTGNVELMLMMRTAPGCLRRGNLQLMIS